MRFRFSGHESFPCRYTWLPKAYNVLSENPDIFSDDNAAMVKLGVGKNMVKAIRFWVQAFGIAKINPTKSGLELTVFGKKIFQSDGLDPFLEDTRTLWLLHWKISSITTDPLFAWYFLLNQWADPTFSRSEVILAFTRESERMDRPLSDFTKEQHFDIFLHTYLPARSKKSNEVLEDSLDCPLTELQFVVAAGERVITETGKRESIFEFRQDSKSEISGHLFTYCLFDFWKNNRAVESTISFREVSAIPGSIGQIFKLNESELRTRLENVGKDSDGLFEYIASASVPKIIKHFDFNGQTEELLLRRIYKRENSNAKNSKKISDVHAN